MTRRLRRAVQDLNAMGLKLKSLLGFKETEKLFSWNDIFARSDNGDRLQRRSG